MKRLLLFLFLFPLLTIAQTKGKVVGITDGDTFTILTEEKQQIKVRFYGIDCPEISQGYGYMAKKFTNDKSFELSVTIQDKGYDKYERLLGIVILPDKENLNELLLKNGFAWHYKKYDDNPRWAEMEQEARKAKVGLWQEADPMAPWAFREMKRKSELK